VPVLPYPLSVLQNYYISETCGLDPVLKKPMDWNNLISLVPGTIIFAGKPAFKPAGLFFLN